MAHHEYTERDIGIELRNIETRKAHGSGGIPGVSYKEKRKWTSRPITGIMNKIESGQEIPGNLTNGTVA